MDITESYKQRPKLDEHYDAIMIGSGLGCLTTANILAKKGKKVLVLEKHYTAGGFTHVFARPEYEWDVGVHYVGDVHKKGTVMNRLFEYLSNGTLKWADMGEVYDRIVFGEEIYDFVKGTSKFKAKLKEYFPNEADAIDAYINSLYQVSKDGRNFMAEKVMPEAVRFFLSDYLRKKYLKFATKTTRQQLEAFTKNEELIGVLTGQYGDYGLPPAESSYVMHASVAKHYMTNGGAYPIGGSIEFLNTIAPDILKNGGKILTNAQVCGVEIENNKSIGVKMKDGKILKADKIVSGIGVLNTINHLIPDSHQSKFPKKDYKTIPASVSHVSLYIGIQESSSALNLPKANFWIYPDNYNHDENIENYLADPENNDFPVIYISFPSAKDPDFENRFPNKSTIEIITLAPYEWFEKWDGTRWKKRGDEYEALKEKFSQRMLQELYKRLPHLEGKIDYYELSTPLSTKHFTSYDKGEIYGIEHTPARYKNKALRPKTAIKNFYLTGQDVLSAGIGGAAFAGVLTASAILKTNVVKEIIAYK